MITEDISDLIKVGVGLGMPTASWMGVPLQDWMYIISIFAGLLLIMERLPMAYKSLTQALGRVKAYGARFKK